MNDSGQRSLFGEILDWMLVPLLLLWPMSLGLTGVVAQELANRPYDRALGETARLVANQLGLEPGATPGEDERSRAGRPNSGTFPGSRNGSAADGSAVTSGRRVAAATSPTRR